MTPDFGRPTLLRALLYLPLGGGVAILQLKDIAALVLAGLRGTSLPHDWLADAALSLFVLACALLLIWSYYKGLRTRIDADGISTLTFAGQKTIRWAELTGVSRAGIAVIFESQAQRLVVPVGVLYTKPREVLDYIRHRLPRQLYLA